MYQVSPPWIAWFASLRSEEVVIGKSAQGSMDAYQVSLPCIAWFASLRSEEVVIEKVPEAIFCSWLSWKHRNTHTYQVSPLCIAWFASLRSEEVVIEKVPEAIFVTKLQPAGGGGVWVWDSQERQAWLPCTAEKFEAKEQVGLYTLTTHFVYLYPAVKRGNLSVDHCL